MFTYRRNPEFSSSSFQPRENYSQWRLLYFISFLLLVGFFVLNMFVGVVVENFHRCREEQEKEEKARRAAKRAKKLEKKRRSKLLTSSCNLGDLFSLFFFSRSCLTFFPFLFSFINVIFSELSCVSLGLLCPSSCHGIVTYFLHMSIVTLSSSKTATYFLISLYDAAAFLFSEITFHLFLLFFFQKIRTREIQGRENKESSCSRHRSFNSWHRGGNQKTQKEEEIAEAHEASRT